MRVSDRMEKGPNISGMLGVTLIELMIVVAIIGILAAIGYPNYKAYTDRGKRAEGRAMLAEVANRMERMYSDCNAYPAALATTGSNNCTGTGTVVIPSLTSESNSYAIAISAVTGTRQSFTLTVTPQGAWTDPDCGNLTLGSDGARDRSGTGKTVDECWGK